MDDPIQPRFLAHLESLGPCGLAQVISHLRLLKARSYVPDTLRGFTTTLKLFVSGLPTECRATVAGDLSLAEPRDLDSFIEAEQSRGLSPVTINGRLSQLREFFRFLVEEGVMARHPVTRRHRLAAPESLPRPMPDSDLVRFFKAVDSVRDRLIFLFMLRCGLRVSEACALEWDDVDLPSLSVRVNGGKGDVDRIAYLAPNVEQSLRQWQARRIASPYLFPSRKAVGSHIGRRNVYMTMRKYLSDAGLGGRYSPHCLRHTFATHLLNAGVTLEVLKELMGHRPIRMTLRYAQLYDETKRALPATHLHDTEQPVEGHHYGLAHRPGCQLLVRQRSHLLRRNHR